MTKQVALLRIFNLCSVHSPFSYLKWKSRQNMDLSSQTEMFSVSVLGKIGKAGSETNKIIDSILKD